MKEVIVTGGRDYDDWVMLSEVLEFINPDVVIQGGATGADALARKWAQLEDKKCITFPANWEEHGKAAGPIHNREMLRNHPNAAVIAFPGGKGTAHCVKEAFYLNRIILEVHK